MRQFSYFYHHPWHLLRCFQSLKTALHFAAEKGYSEIVSLLLDYGATIGAREFVSNLQTHITLSSEKKKIRAHQKTFAICNTINKLNSAKEYGKNPPMYYAVYYCLKLGSSCSS